jgi:hypothetical protein
MSLICGSWGKQNSQGHESKRKQLEQQKVKGKGEERATWVNMIKVCYIYASICHNETPDQVKVNMQ